MYALSGNHDAFGYTLLQNITKSFSWVAEKDSSGLLQKEADTVIELYHWTDEDKKANEIDEAVNGD